MTKITHSKKSFIKLGKGLRYALLGCVASIALGFAADGGDSFEDDDSQAASMDEARFVERFGDCAAVNTNSPYPVTDIDPQFTLGGFVYGSVQSIDVSSIGTTASKIVIKIGRQDFTGTLMHAESNDDFRLTSIDTSNYMSLNISGNGLTGAAVIRSELRVFFGLDATMPLFVSAASSDLSSYFAQIVSYRDTDQGMYGVRFGYCDIDNQVTYKLTDGNQCWTKVYDAYSANDAVIGEAARTVVFGNGLTLITTETNDETSPPIGIEYVQVLGDPDVYRASDEKRSVKRLDYFSPTECLEILAQSDVDWSTGRGSPSQHVEWVR
jgi:hypothetical protein